MGQTGGSCRRTLMHSELGRSFWAPNGDVMFHQNRLKVVTIRVGTDSWDQSYSISCYAVALG